MIAAMNETLKACDVLIIGSGLAGLTAALTLPKNLNIVIISKTQLCSGASKYAQGGIAAAQNNKASQDQHIDDTLKAGAHTNHPNHTQSILAQGQASIQWLQQQGIHFDTHDHNYSLHQEGGHSVRRIYHIADHTGLAIAQQLSSNVQQAPHIQTLCQHIAIDLITHNNQCLGAHCYVEDLDIIHTYQAKHVILATGGASKIYLYSSNPETASGDGIAMAHRAGAATLDLAFNQFHPTCLYHPNAGSFLITEAIRGEGGHLLTPQGQRFMEKYHPSGELAPRDIVARAIDHEIKRLGSACMWLDISHRDSDWLKQAFPTIYQKCLTCDIDITQQPIPIVPAAHYTCGGVKTDLNGQTSIKNLFAIGEVAHTGLHGANRLASNSLLECVVMAQHAAQAISKQANIPMPHQAISPWDESKVRHSDQAVVVKHCWDACRRLMWDYVGIVRSDERLAHAKQTMTLLNHEIEQYYQRFRVDRHLIECRNLICVAQQIIRACQNQTQNIGLHYNVDLTELEV
jgi:L-aspartate oxidase